MDGIKVHDQGRRAPGAGAKSEDAVAATQRPCIPRRRPGRSSGQDDDGLAERSELSRQTSFLPELRRRRIADTRSQRDIPHARDLSCIACHSGRLICATRSGGRFSFLPIDCYFWRPGGKWRKFRGPGIFLAASCSCVDPLGWFGWPSR
jgi:hypothetical protein